MMQEFIDPIEKILGEKDIKPQQILDSWLISDFQQLMAAINRQVSIQTVEVENHGFKQGFEEEVRINRTRFFYSEVDYEGIGYFRHSHIWGQGGNYQSRTLLMKQGVPLISGRSSNQYNTSFDDYDHEDLGVKHELRVYDPCDPIVKAIMQ